MSQIIFRAGSPRLNVCLLILASLLVFSGFTRAAESLSEHSAHGIVKGVQDQLLETIHGEDNIAVNDEAAYLKQVKKILTPVVDFRYIARGVMGGYAKQASKEQRENFADVFQYGLVSTYAKGMASYADQTISILPPKGDISGQKTISVLQEVRGEDGVNRVSYTMKLNRAGEWKLVNVVLNGINLGITFRTQFYQAMKKRSGDIELVIAEWSAE